MLPDPLFETQEGAESERATNQLLQSALEEDDNEYEDSDQQMKAESQPVQPVQYTGKFGGGGLNTLLHVDEASALRHGSVNIELKLSCGNVLSPLSVESSHHTVPPPQETSLVTDNLQRLSLNGYLDICKTHLQFGEMDILFAKTLYEVIDGTAEKGIPLINLQDHPTLRNVAHSFSLEHHIQCLLNLEMVRPITLFIINLFV